MRVLPIFAAMALIPFAGAKAETIPKFDVARYCATSEPSAGAADGCRKAEEGRRNQILAQWESFPLQRRHFCLQSVAFLKKEQRSYTPLLQCLEDPRPAKTS